MDYEKAYNEAIKRAKAIIEVAEKEEEVYKSAITIFPELYESEDEKVRKDVKRAISVALDYSYFDKETANNCLAWLEKQGYTKKDVDEIIKNAEDHAYFAGSENTREKLIDKACKWWEEELTYPSMTPEEFKLYKSKVRRFRKDIEDET